MTQLENPNIYFEITDKCNHQCSFCGKAWRTDCGNTLSYHDLDIIISYPKAVSKITGGEPGIEKQKCFYYFEHETAPLTLNTNLTSWTKDDISYLNNRNVFLMIDAPSIFEDEYNTITKSRFFKTYLQNLYVVSKINSSITMVICEENVNTFERSFLTLCNMGFSKFIISPAVPNKASSFNYREALKKIDKLYEEYSSDIYIRTLGRTLPAKTPPSHECQSGKELMVILSNGDVVPCAWNNNHILGNIRKNTYEEIRADGLAYRESIKSNICQGFLENCKTYHIHV